MSNRTSMELKPSICATARQQVSEQVSMSNRTSMELKLQQATRGQTSAVVSMSNRTSMELKLFSPFKLRC